MDTNANKQRWVDEVMESTNGMTKAQSAAGLQERIDERLSAPFTRNTVAMPIRKWVAAAVILLAVNVGSAVYFSKQHREHTPAMSNPFAAEMQAASTYNY